MILLTCNRKIINNIFLFYHTFLILLDRESESLYLSILSFSQTHTKFTVIQTIAISFHSIYFTCYKSSTRLSIMLYSNTLLFFLFIIFIVNHFFLSFVTNNNSTIAAILIFFYLNNKDDYRNFFFFCRNFLQCLREKKHFWENFRN